MKNRTVFIIAAALAGNTVSFAADQAIAPIVVTASQHEYRDTEAPYASEVHTRRDIEASGSTSLYDYLSSHSSVTVMPSYGNPFNQRLDMRGYGIGDGYQNIVVTINGRRLNNIDMVPQLLSSLPLAAIERIEITKGSGSVIYGDGAMAGAIHIHTRSEASISAKAAAGSDGMTSSSIYAGISEGIAALNVTAENYRHDGYSDTDINGQRDSADSNNLQAGLKLFPAEALELRLGGSRSRIDTVYRGYLSEAQFDDDPAQNGGASYTGQTFTTDATRLGLSYGLSRSTELIFDHSEEDKRSEFSSGWAYNYDTGTTDLALHYKADKLSLTAGASRFDGLRSASGSETGKENAALYLQGHLSLGATTLSAGVRREKVKYSYDPAVGSALDDELNLSAFDVGINRRINPQLTLFGNYNSAYQAPDVDRFFTTDWFTMTTSFNEFIDPAKSRTVNLGANHLQGNNKLKLTLFYSWLTDEIYYYSTGPWSGINTNIDRSHKYGLELQDDWRINDRLSASLNYAYTRAVIDEENEGGGSYDGQEMPGVSAHTASLGLNYTPSERSSFSLNHSYRSEAYAANDFANDFEQKQAAYNSTDLLYRYRLRNVELSAGVENLFANANGMWVSDDVIYPVDFSRRWQLGLRADF